MWAPIGRTLRYVATLTSLDVDEERTVHDERPGDTKAASNLWESLSPDCIFRAWIHSQHFDIAFKIIAMQRTKERETRTLTSAMIVKVSYVF